MRDCGHVAACGAGSQSPYAGGMSIPRLAQAGRFDPERLFHPGSIALLGAETRLGGLIHANLLLAGFAGTISTKVTSGIDLAVIAEPAERVIAAMEALAAVGCFAAIVASDAPGLPDSDLAAAALRTGVRVIGPNAFGLAATAIGLNATSGHLPAPAGRLALVSQSAGLCRAVIDWAGPNGVGFSHVIGLGRAADLGFAAALDWLSRDAGTGAILLDVHAVKDRRGFLSAARAASRLRPVVAMRSGGRWADPEGRADRVFEAALRRAGVLYVESLEDLLSAAETLARSRPARGECVAIVGNAWGPTRLAADAVLRLGLRVGSVVAVETASVATGVARALATPDVGGVLAVLAPDGDVPVFGSADRAPPLLVCALGETTGAARGRALAEQGMAVFATPEGAARAFLHLARDRRNRLAARELPDRLVLSVAPDRARVAGLFAAARAAGQTVLCSADSATVLSLYGVGAPYADSITVRDDPEFGPTIGFGAAVGLPPLNMTLARDLAEGCEAAAEALVRVSQAIVDFPEIAALQAGSIQLRAAGKAAEPLAIMPYPADLIAGWGEGDDALIIRPIRPEDAAAHAAFFARLSPLDIRFRFFSALRVLPAEQLARLTQVDYAREIAFVAVRSATAETVGVARLARESAEDRGEFAVIVQPAMKGKGLASALMRHLLDWARAHGFREVVGQILADNAPMLKFVRALGFTVRRLPDDPEVMEATLVL